MTIAVVFEEDVQRWICGYAPLSGRSFEEKQSFFDELKYEWDMHSEGDVVMCLSDFIGHVVRHTDGFDRVHGELGVCQTNLEGRML